MTASLEQTGNRKPTYARDQESLWREIRKLWASVNDRTSGLIEDIPFTIAGKIYMTTSARYYPRKSCVLQRVLMSLDVPGTTTSTATIYKNEDPVGTISLGSGSDKTQTSLAVHYQADTDYLRVAVTTTGAAAGGLDVQCRIKFE
jgi:hypothetical protein